MTRKSLYLLLASATLSVAVWAQPQAQEIEAPASSAPHLVTANFELTRADGQRATWTSDNAKSETTYATETPEGALSVVTRAGSPSSEIVISLTRVRWQQFPGGATRRGITYPTLGQNQLKVNCLIVEKETCELRDDDKVLVAVRWKS